jgi:competence protein ComEC
MSQSTVRSRTEFSLYPLAILAVCFATGVVVAQFALPSLPVFVSCGAVCSVLLLFAHQKRRVSLSPVLLAIAIFCLGGAFTVIEKKSVAADRVLKLVETGKITAGQPVEVTGTLDRPPEYGPVGFYLALRTERILIKESDQTASGVVWLFAPVRDRRVGNEYDELKLRYGARLRVMVALSRVESFRNPGVPSFTDYLDHRGFDATGIIKSPLLIERLDDERVFVPLAWLYEWRLQLLRSMRENFSPETAGVLGASLLGNRYFLSLDAADRFREGGTFHVLVISGVHISFIGLVVLLLMRRVTRRKIWQFSVSVLVVWAYAVAVGAEASVVRAALVFTLVAIAPIFQRSATSLNALGGTALALLVWRPSDLFDPSFQLTFLSVLAIVAFAWPLIQKLHEVGNWRLTHEQPMPPLYPFWWRVTAETLFWSEREWEKEMAHSPWRCRLFKSRSATWFEKVHLQKPARYAMTAVVVSIAVQLVLLPLQVLYFHRISLSSIFLNVMVGIVMALLSFSALAALLVAQVSQTLAVPLIWLTEGLNWLMIHSVDPFRTVKLASMRLPEYSGAGAVIYALYFAALVPLAFALARWQPLSGGFRNSLSRRRIWQTTVRATAAMLVVLIVLVIFHPFSAHRTAGRLQIDFLDVGQGDAALITTPDDTTILIDGGGRPRFDNRRDEREEDETIERDSRSVGEAVVSEYLWWRGRWQVDYLVATHADADHMDGLNDAAENFEIRSALVGRSPAHDAEFTRFAGTLQSEEVPLYLIGRGDSLQIGDVTIDVLWPMATNVSEARSRNDDSIVLRVRFGERVFLLTGDIERKSEAWLAQSAAELRADLVKVAHHGSRTSSIESFVRAVHPSHAIISVGLQSSYGHPHKEVVERWRNAGAEVLTTGECGTISVSTDGHDLRVERFVK